MRTQKSVQSVRSLSTLRQTPYICTSCRRHATQSASTVAARSIRGPASVFQNPDNPAVAPPGKRLVRWLSHSSRRSSLINSSPSSINGHDSILAPVYAGEEANSRNAHSKEDTLPDHDGTNHASREDIRSRLRKWSEEQSILSGSLPPKFSTIDTIAPNNSIFSKEAERQDDEQPFELDQDNFDPEDEVPTKDNFLGLEPGDVFFGRNVMGVHPQFVMFLGLRELRKAEVLLSDGRWAIALSKLPNQVVLPGFARPEEAEFLRACIAEHPTFKRALDADKSDISDATMIGDFPVALTETFTQRLRSLSEAAIEFQRQHPDKLDSLYARFAHEEKFVSLEFGAMVQQAFDQELETLSMGARYAIFSALRKNEDRHTIVRSKSTRIDVFFTPVRLQKQIVQVMAWAREYQDCAARAAVGHDVSADLRVNPLNSFINKARRIILKSRKIRSPTTIGSLGPSSNNRVRPDGSVETRDTGETITSGDHSIIEFMWTVYLRRPSPHTFIRGRSVGALILRAVGAYPKMQLDLEIARLFFREMGLSAPWSEAMDDDLRVPAPGRRGAVVAQELIRKSDEHARKMNFNPDAGMVEDTMAPFRKDWGSVEVICIDRPNTSILDDGLSLEESTEFPGATWIHVHEAHPSAFLNPHGIFADRARELTAAIYTSSKLYGMLPDEMLTAWSLKANAPVLTVSTLLLENGEVQDVKVSVGIIRKVIRLDPDEVEAVRGTESDSAKASVLQVGPTITRMSHPDMSSYEDASKHAEFIQLLDRIVTARMRKREEQLPAPTWKVLTAEVRDNVSWVEPFDGSRHTRSYHYLGDPTIKIVAPHPQVVLPLHERYSQRLDLNAEAMLLAGESLGLWLKAQNIPAVFRGTAFQDKEHTVARLNEKEEAGELLAGSLPRTITTSSPVSHSILSMSCYVRATSPLRRYSDNVAHWQINAYIKAEAEGRLPASGDLSEVLPFSKDEIDKYIRDGHDTSEKLELLKRKASVHWTMQAIFRAFHFKEAPLPEIWDARITQPNIRLMGNINAKQDQPDIADMVASLQPFALRTLILKSKEGWEVGVEKFQCLPVKIEYVDTTWACVFVRPVGPPSWTPTQNGTLHCVKPENEAKAEL